MAEALEGRSKDRRTQGRERSEVPRGTNLAWHGESVSASLRFHFMPGFTRSSLHFAPDTSHAFHAFRCWLKPMQGQQRKEGVEVGRGTCAAGRFLSLHLSLSSHPRISEGWGCEDGSSAKESGMQPPRKAALLSSDVPPSFHHARLHFLTCQVESCTFPLTCRHMAAVRLTVLR